MTEASSASGSDRDGGRLFTPRTPRIVAARRLQRRRDRDQTGRFLAEGPQAVAAALAAGVVVELFATPSGLSRHPALTSEATLVSEEALAALAETMHPQGLVAVCSVVDVSLSPHRLTAVLADIRDPGNAGTILRTADAAGAGAVVFAGDAVDPYNGKCVRASAGSLFHVDVVRSRSAADVVSALRRSGVRVLAATGYGDVSLDDLVDDGSLAGPTAWLFGSEAHGLSEELLAAADARVRVPLYGGAESLNLAAAAAVCLYSSARAQR
ncbi:RNA methyltransferase [Actinoplanes sp. NPDC051470]|uniref:TrmH family RNA methyltransferase n=1 Tax=unclassified Actinoplanes TaxID=2626549 RepID=UPI0034389854